MMHPNLEIVLGSPGCGKTTALLRIVEEELARGTDPRRIGFISFTRRAAIEAIDRACDKFSLTRSQFPWFRTTHSLCFRALGLSSSEVLEGRRLQAFGDIVGYKITGRFSTDEGGAFGFEKGDRLLFMEGLSRVRRVPLRDIYDEDDDGLSFLELSRFAEALAAYKRDLGVIDYTDMLTQFVNSGTTVKLDVLLVDESQDNSKLGWDVVRKLAQNCRRVVIAGDDQQALFRWAGADVDTFITMPGTVRVLEQSWRIPQSVQNVANNIISRVSMQRKRTWRPRPEMGLVQYHTSTDSVDLSGKDILVLARNKFLLKEYEKDVRSAGYLYEINGQPSIKSELLDAVRTWERLRKDRGGVLATDARKMYGLMTLGKAVARGSKGLPGFSDEQVVTYTELVDKGGLLVSADTPWFDALDKIPHEEVAYIRAARRRGEDVLSSPRIRLSTIHAMKGGEAHQVVLLTDIASRTYDEYLKNPDDEARVFYVGVTRAKQELHIIAPKTTRCYPI